MNRSTLILLIFITSILNNPLSAGTMINTITLSTNTAISDTFPEYQFLFNGRVWKDLYISVEGDQFLFSKEPMHGSVTMRGRTYSGVRIMYDIFTDEIQIPYKPVGILQLNKEMVDSFSILHLQREFHFVRIANSINNDLNGYFHVLYNGEIKLYAKYIKKIEKFADGGMYDKFYQINSLFLIKDGEAHSIKRKNDLIRIFDDKSKIIRNYIKNNNITISKVNGDSFVRVIGFIDNLK
jgi:hypothetical protein